MDRRYLHYRRRKFDNWKNRVKKHLPAFVAAFYSIDGYIDYYYHKMLGRVILNINDPFYSIEDKCKGGHVDSIGEMANEILLEMDVNTLFSFIKSKNIPHA